MGYLVYKCDECGAVILADGGAFLAHKKKRHNSRGYGRSKIVAIIRGRERKYEFRDVAPEERERWIEANGVPKSLEAKSEREHANTSNNEDDHVYVID